ASARSIGASVLRESIERLAALARVALEPPAREPGAPLNGDGDDEPPASHRPPAPYELTERELQILPLLAAGYTNRQIGEALFISPSTAGVHVSRILGKMGVTSRVEAAAVAVRAGLAG
ncbi:MAG: LuxR C-terminal-related transcriptional regulator, partial [Chloroflexota bacterium]|nr:LuxR C-terminal-related transcriptional regulator [Chloroflexota bacterium]